MFGETVRRVDRMSAAALLATLVAARILIWEACDSVASAAEDATLVVGRRACLFLDDRFVASQTGFRRVWHQARPRPDVAIRDRASSWERWPHLFGSTLFDPKANVYRMYYESAISPSRTPPNSFTTYVCYAESTDGKAWTRPTLRLFEDLGSKENNIVVHCAEFPKVFVDPRETDPAARLKMFVYLNGKPPLMGGNGECLLGSGDGLHWKFLGAFQKPAYARPEQGNFTDTFSFLYDPLGERYMAFIRTFDKSHVAESRDGRRRAIGVSFSRSVNRDWSPIAQVLAPDARDDARVAALGKDAAKPDWAEHYCMPIFVYGNHYLGMLSLLYLIDGVDSNGGGDLQLAWSHDGVAWFRPPSRPSLIAPGPAAPELFPTYVSINGPLEIGDELWLYHTEANGAHPVAPFEKAVSQIRAAVWRRDGFVSLDADDRGTVTTKPLRCDGPRLIVNVRCADGGRTRAAILDERGNPLPGFGLDDCEPLTGDVVRGEVRWKGTKSLSSLEGRTVRLRLDVEKGALFSFRFAGE